MILIELSLVLSLILNIGLVFKLIAAMEENKELEIEYQELMEIKKV
jgi:hypothetical protein